MCMVRPVQVKWRLHCTYVIIIKVGCRLVQAWESRHVILTAHTMFGWSHNQYSQAVVAANQQTKLARLKLVYENVDIFVIDEVNAMSAAELVLLDETMCKIFDPDGNVKDDNGFVRPFGGKTMGLCAEQLFMIKASVDWKVNVDVGHFAPVNTKLGWQEVRHCTLST